MKTMKKAQAGVSIPKKPATKPAVKKSIAPAPKPAPKRKTYPIIPDETTSDGYLKLGPREKTPGGGFSRNGSKLKKAQMGTEMMQSPMMKKGGAMKKCKYGCK